MNLNIDPHSKENYKNINELSSIFSEYDSSEFDNTNKSNKSNTKVPHFSQNHPFQIIIVDLIVLAMAFILIFFIISLLSFSMYDPAWSRTTVESTEIHNVMGKIGAYSADVLYYFFGLSAWWINFFLIFTIFNLAFLYHSSNAKNTSFSFSYSLIGLIILLLTGSMLEKIYLTDIIQESLPLGAGGLIGNTLTPIFSQFLGNVLSGILLLTLCIGGFVLTIQTSWLYLFHSIRTSLLNIAMSLLNIFTQKNEDPKDEKEKTLLKAQFITQKPIEKPNFAVSSREIKLKQQSTQDTTKEKIRIKGSLSPIEPIQKEERPILYLLKKSFKKLDFNQKEVKQMAVKQSEVITRTFNKNNIANKLIKVDIGPVFFNYHIKLNLPINSQEVQQSYTDLKKSLDNKNVFLKQISPTRADYELLIAKKRNETVSLMEIFSQKEFSNSNENLVIALGKDIHNKPVLTSLENMPNFLIASNDHSNNLLGMQAAIASLIARNTSQNMRMIFMGKNETDFGSYINLPHLIAPVIKKPTCVLNTINWCLNQAQKRLKILHDTQSKDINELNKKIYAASEKNIFIADPFSEDLDNPSPLKPLSFLVIFISELNWLNPMLQQIDKELLRKLIQYCKEIGIHLVSTQSTPSIQSITPTLKYAFPTRLAFKVNTHIQSLLILNQTGAEQLLSTGDCLLLLPDHLQTIHLQIGTLSRKECSQLMSNFDLEPIFDEDISNYQAKKHNEPQNHDLYDMAVQHILNSQKTSISFLQRKMKIGYNLANQLLEQMQDNGILSKAELGGRRKILIDNKQIYTKDKK
ncbi:MAG: hypothetical protein GKC53_06375 [Neisseriaceae bacterium]|nr:MAG: hypothetical protein GKC53_06375 [Neisseriaceae bacterium]